MRASLRREGALRVGLAARDQATQQAVELGRRRLRWLMAGGICALLGFGLIVMMVLIPLGKPSRFAIPQPAQTPIIQGIPPIEPFAPGVMVDPQGVPIDPPAHDAPNLPAQDAQPVELLPTAQMPAQAPVPRP
jgi:hypothetical protein